MKIVFDFDGVICDSQSEMIRILNERANGHYKLEDWSVYNYNKCFPTDDCGHFKDIFRENIYGDKTPYYAGALFAIYCALDNGHDVKIMSDCADENVYRYKKQYLKSIGLSDILFEPVYNGNKNTALCDMLVEDCFENLKNSSAKYKLLVNKPWNCNLNDAGIIRVKNDIDLLNNIKSIVTNT